MGVWIHLSLPITHTLLQEKLGTSRHPDNQSFASRAVADLKGGFGLNLFQIMLWQVIKVNYK